MQLTRAEFATLIEQAMCGATVDDDRLTPEEQAALAALNGARPSSRHDLIGAAWGVYAQRDPDRARRRERRAAASQHHTVDADENPTTKTSGY